MAVTIKTVEEIALLREGGRRLATILEEVAARVAPGVSTLDLDCLAEERIVECGGRPSFKGYRIKGIRIPYPASLCTSINNEVVHAIPSAVRILKEGDIIGLDIGMEWPVKDATMVKKSSRGFFTDMAVTIGVGKISPDATRLIHITEDALSAGIAVVRAGVHVGDIGAAVEKVLKQERLGVIRDLAGHGVGYQVHEDPLIPNFGDKGIGSILKENMVIAVEPMATLGGDWRIKLLPDQWTYVTRDGSLAAHFEHTLVVLRDGAEVLTR